MVWVTHTELRAYYSHPLPVDFRHAVLTLSQSATAVFPAQLAELDVYAGRLFAEAAQLLLKKAGINAEEITAIGSHGQTLYHQPQGKFPYTWQIGDPNIIAWQTGITTVADFRRKDLAAGGQGAPLVPAFHQATLHNPFENRLVLNIGGIANLTVLPAAPDSTVIGFDTGPGNALLDAWSQQQRGEPFDRNGEWANSYAPDAKLLEKLLTDPYFQKSPPKSTGRDYFNLAWLQKYAIADLPPGVVQATLLNLTLETISRAVEKFKPQRLLVCGGGVHNAALFAGLTQRLSPCPVQSTAVYGLDPDWLEALCFAWLAKRTLDGQPGNLPTVTGAQQSVVLGGIYSGRYRPPENDLA